MAINFQRTTYSGHTPEIWRGECKILPGGFKPKQTFPIGTVLHRGTPIEVDYTDMSAAVVKTAKVVAGGTTTKPRVAKGHYFVVGDVVTKYGSGASTPTVNAIDTTNADYDVLTLSAAITGLAANDVLVESEAPASGETATPKYTPNAVVGAVLEFDGKGIPTIDAAYEAVVLFPSLLFPVLDEWLNGFSLKCNPSIKLIKQ